MNRVLFFACMLISACAEADEISNKTLEIHDFKFGYVCPAELGDPDYTEYPGETSGISGGEICQEAKRIRVTSGQKCIFDKESYPCTWYGYEFYYKNMPDNVSLNCVALSNLPGNSGNPKGIISKNSKRTEFQLELESGAGRFYNPLYVIALKPDQSAENIVLSTTCNISGKEVFNYSAEIVFPDSPKNLKP